MRKFFSKEEIEDWASEDWNWALQNLKADEDDKIELIKNVFNFVKPYINLDLYKAEKEMEDKKEQQLQKDNKTISEFNTENTQFSIDSRGGDVFSETIEFEEDEIPLILEK